MIYVFLATGFEEIEALAPIDIMRRAGLDVATVSINAEKAVVGAHGVPVVADILLDEVDFEAAEMIVLPGGLPGSTNLDACESLREGIRRAYADDKSLAAICAAPMVYGHMGLLRGRRATCYPGCEGHMEGAEYTAAIVEEDGPFITGRGPAAALEFGYALVERILGEGASLPLREGMMYSQLMAR